MNRREFIAAAGAVPALGLPHLQQAASGPPQRRPSDVWVEVDLDRIGFNLESIRRKARRRKVMAVVKANGYGHGLVELGRYLDSKGIDGLMVGNFREALTLREAGVRATILNFGPAFAVDPPSLIEQDVSQVVSTPDVDALSDEGRKRGRKARVHVLVDTGLGRLGVPYHEASIFIEKLARLPGVRVEGVMTAFTEDRDFDPVQLARFNEVHSRARSSGIDLGIRHAASSDGLLAYGEDFLLDMVRLGILLYGQYPSSKAAAERPIELRPALSLKAGVAYVKTLRQGDSVSYHRRFVAERATTVATLALGYSDGYPTALADEGEVLIAGGLRPIIAPITANHTVVQIDRDSIGIGDEAVLVGEQGGMTLGAEAVASRAGVSVYRFLIGLSPLVPRVYLGGA